MSDKFFSSVQLLCGFNGADAATAFTDESAAARIATFSGNAQLDTARSRWGSASLLVDGTGDFVTFPDAAALTLGTGDFCVETWIWPNAVGINQCWASHYNATGSIRAWAAQILATGGLQFAFSGDGTSVTNASFTPFTWVAGQWYHVLFDRNGANLRAFVDGVQIGSTFNIGVSTIFNTSAVLTIAALGGTSPSQFVNGWMDDTRLTVGQSRRTANFAPPQGPFDRAKHTGSNTKRRGPVILTR